MRARVARFLRALATRLAPPRDDEDEGVLVITYRGAEIQAGIRPDGSWLPSVYAQRYDPSYTGWGL